jgi:hypothetical protein
MVLPHLASDPCSVPTNAMSIARSITPPQPHSNASFLPSSVGRLGVVSLRRVHAKVPHNTRHGRHQESHLLNANANHHKRWLLSLAAACQYSLCLLPTCTCCVSAPIQPENTISLSPYILIFFEDFVIILFFSCYTQWHARTVYYYENTVQYVL